ncbi:MAG: DUF2088 domain-containing protein [Chthonomonadales bacterium]|nr:DUF2088 domain-containing protein [Chthonomonadales bacterium]
MIIDFDTHAYDFADIALPEVWTIRHRVDAPVIEDITASVRQAVSAFQDDPRLKPGASIAMGVGSRGIANLSVMVRAAVEALIELGCQPFIVPAMGSHGGATAEGQMEILASYGVTAEAMGVPVRATMEVDRVGSLDDGYPIYFDRYALEADGVIVLNRVKHHTDFKGPIESGLCKMCAIGLGKRQGAEAIHRFGADGLSKIMPEVGRRLVQVGDVIGGIAIIENPYGQTAEIHGLRGADIGREAETALLERARSMSPRLAFDQADVLVVDEMGKDISGTGMDTHVLGRVRMPSVPETDWDGPDIRMVVTLGLTEATHGNAAGLCLADIVTEHLMEQIDLKKTFTNHRTSQEGGAYRGGIPIVLHSPDAAVRAAIGMCGRGDRSQVRLVRIQNTEHISRLQVSEAFLAEVERRSDLTVEAGPEPLQLDRTFVGR